jgi:hypothetical protein
MYTEWAHNEEKKVFYHKSIESVIAKQTMI